MTSDHHDDQEKSIKRCDCGGGTGLVMVGELWAVKCSECGTIGPAHDCEADAVRAWNAEHR